MQRFEVSGAVRPIYGSLGLKRLIKEMAEFVSVGARLWCVTYWSSRLLSLEFGHRLVCVADDRHGPKKEHYIGKTNSCLF